VCEISKVTLCGLDIDGQEKSAGDIVMSMICSQPGLAFSVKEEILSR